MTTQEDIQRYPVYMFYDGILQQADWVKESGKYNNNLQMHHFIRQSVRKNSNDFYKKVEHLQKLILMPSKMNYDLETMGAERFKEVWGVNKDDFVFSRKKWREGYYENS